MARTKLTKERTTQILDALELCIKIKGLQNTKLEDIADQSNMKRPALRHFIGNRDQIIIKLAERIVDQAIQRTKSFDSILEANGKTPQQASLSLIIKAVETDTARAMTIHQLFNLSSSVPKIKKLMQRWFSIYVSWLSKTMVKFYQEPKATLDQTAAGIVMTCIAQGAIGSICTQQMDKLIAGSIFNSLNQLTPK